MPKARQNRTTGSAGPTAQPHSNPPRNDGNLSIRPHRSRNGTDIANNDLTADMPKPISLSEEILRQMTGTAAPLPSQTPTFQVNDGDKAGASSSQKQSKKRSRDGPSDDESSSKRPMPGDQQSTYELKHAHFWQQCLPATPAVYSSIIVDITKVMDERSLRVVLSKPIVFRRLCFLTRHKAPVDPTDPFPVATTVSSVSRFAFQCRPGPEVNLTDSRRYANVRDYTRKLMTIMARNPALPIAESEMPYLLVPVRHEIDASTDGLDAEAIIDWEEVDAFANGQGRMLQRDEVADADRLKRIVDDGLFSYHHTDVSARFEVVALRTDLHAYSTPEKTSEDENILAAQPRKWREKQDVLWDSQPVFEVATAWDLHTMLRPASSLRTTRESVDLLFIFSRCLIAEEADPCHSGSTTVHPKVPFVFEVTHIPTPCHH